MDFQQVLKAHVEWKFKLRNALAAKEQVDASTLGRDDACAFGKWLHGEGRTALGNDPAYHDCVTAHAAFHREAAKIAQAINAKRYAEAEAAMGATSVFNKLSTDTAVCIGRLRKVAGQ